MKPPCLSNTASASTLSPSLSSLSSATGSSCQSETSKWKQSLNRLDSLDQWVSRPLFELSLPSWLEAIYTVPACFFGLVPSLAIGPLWVAHLACENLVSRDVLKHESMTSQQRDKLVLMRDVTYVLSTVFVLAWGLFLIGYTSAVTKFLGKNLFYLISYGGSIAFLFHILLMPRTLESEQEDSSTTFGVNAHEGDALILTQVASLSFYYLVLWSSSVLIVLAVKRWTQRVRPCANKETNGPYIDRKAFPSIARFLAKYQSHASFPSGDATAATALAIPLMCISTLGVQDRAERGDSADAVGSSFFVWNPLWTTTMTIAFWLVILACTGRVYVLAHHVGDVLAGALVPCLLHVLFTYSPFGAAVGLGDVYAIQWYHPIVANMVTTIYALSTLKRHAVRQTMNGNTRGTHKVE